METRVYVIDLSKQSEDFKHYSLIDNEDFMTLAEEGGLVYSLYGFEKAINENELYMGNCYMRII